MKIERTEDNKWIDKLEVTFNQMLDGDEIDIEKLHALLLTMETILSHLQNKTNKQHAIDAEEKRQYYVELAKKTYDNKLVLWITGASTAFHIIAGVGVLAPKPFEIFGNKINALTGRVICDFDMIANNPRKIGKAVEKIFNKLAQGVDTGRSIFQNKKDAERTGAHSEDSTLRQRSDEAHKTAQSVSNQRDGSIQRLYDLQRMINDVVKSLTS